MSVEEVWQREAKSIAVAKSRNAPSVRSLNADISVVDGDSVLASNEESDTLMFEAFASYVLQKS